MYFPIVATGVQLHSNKALYSKALSKVQAWILQRCFFFFSLGQKGTIGSSSSEPVGAARSDGKTLNPGNSSQLPHSTTPAWLWDTYRASAPGRAVQHHKLDVSTAASVRKNFLPLLSSWSPWPLLHPCWSTRPRHSPAMARNSLA